MTGQWMKMKMRLKAHDDMNPANLFDEVSLQLLNFTYCSQFFEVC